MARILHIETATQVCSVALSDDGKLTALRESDDRNSHSAILTIFIDEIMRSAGIAFDTLDAVAVSMGPGSYTGLRIGVSTAKGICFALDKPLIAIGTLHSMAAGMLAGGESGTTERPSISTLLCPMIDARRMEVYNAIFDINLNRVRAIQAEIIHESSFSEELKKGEMWFFGDGAGKCKDILGNSPNAKFIDGFRLSAAYMVNLAEEKYKNSDFEDVVYFEPYYLKDFIPGIPKVKGLSVEG